MTDRREFIHRIVRWGLVAILTGITMLLGRKIVVSRNCSACPEYAECTGTDNCNIKTTES